MEEVVIIGSGMGSLSAAACLIQRGIKPLIIEQNWLPGGCSSSYKRKDYVFETGATTLVGLDEHMPLRYLLDLTGIEIDTQKLDLPMQVHLPDNRIINRYQDIHQWITEAERHFSGNQKAFWEKAYEISQFVWDASTRFLDFPPSRFRDVLALTSKARASDLLTSRHAFGTTMEQLSKYNLESNGFESFIDQQLMITAQNKSPEVNFLFGATSLCYTNYSNHYVNGGLINLINPILDYILRNGGVIKYREGVQSITHRSGHYCITTKNAEYHTNKIISGIPLNNLMDLSQTLIPPKISKKIMSPQKLNSAFQLNLAFKSNTHFESLHHQILLDQPLAETGSGSIFVSLNHPNDHSRSPRPDIRIASISTHITDPKIHFISPAKLEQKMIQTLEKHGFMKSSEILYAHSSGPKSWEKWTGRKFGFVGGYPQYFHTKPWQMPGSRINNLGLYHCGDTAYPGQGIPGATLSGIIAAHKLIKDSY